MCLLDLCIQLLFFLKDKIKSLSGECWKISIWKILKWDHLFLYLIYLKSSMILYLFLKAKSKVKAYISRQLYVVCAWGKTERKLLGKKIGKSFLELTWLIFYLSFKPVLLWLCAFIVCCLFFICGLLEAVIEKCLLNSFLFRLSKIIKKYLWKYLLLRKLQAPDL